MRECHQLTTGFDNSILIKTDNLIEVLIIKQESSKSIFFSKELHKNVWLRYEGISMYQDNYLDKINFFKQMGELEAKMNSSDEIQLKEIVDELSKYDIFDFIARISSLNLLIENQNKSTLLDALIAGILAKNRSDYSGKAKMSQGKLRGVITRLDTLAMRRMVDPPETLFVERVLYYGNYWIFGGINYSPRFCIQAVLNVLCLREIPFAEVFLIKAHLLINFILNVSNSIALRLGYGEESIRNVEPSDLIVVPSAKIAEKIKDCVCLDYSLIEALIPDDEIKHLLFTDFGTGSFPTIIKGQQQSFFSNPFLKTDDGLAIILNPSVLVPFAIHQLVLLAETYEEKETFINAYNEEVWKQCRKNLRKLGHRKIKETEYSINLINDRCRKEVILSVANNKLLFVHFICDDGSDYHCDSIFSDYMVKDDLPTINERRDAFIQLLPFIKEEDVYQIVIINSFGRIVQIPLDREELPKTILLSPEEVYCIAVNERDRDEFLARYIEAKSKLRYMRGLTSISELNAIEQYVSLDYSFYFSDDFSRESTSVMFAPGDSLDYMIRAAKKENRHLIPCDEEHLAEVAFLDPHRNIYYTESSGNRIMSWVIKYDSTNIWLSTEKAMSIDEIDIYYSILDALSYWLSEANTLVNKMLFNTDTICIKISLTPPVDDYYRIQNKDVSFSDVICYEYNGNEIKMIWTPLAYCLLGETNNVEKDMLHSVLCEILKKSAMSVDLSEIEGMFQNPLRQKFHKISHIESPYLVPTEQHIRKISNEEENVLLDEIGEYFLQQPDFDYGVVPDDKRADLANQVVGYLYSLLQCEIASIMPDGVYEQVCSDLEAVMYRSMLYQRRFAYDLACYPEKTERSLAEYNDANRSSLALKFLAEYIAATPPYGADRLSSMQYDRILAICSLIVDWAYKNDLFRYHIFNTPVEFLKSGRIGMKRTEEKLLFNVNSNARSHHLKSLSDPNIMTYSPLGIMEDYQNELDEAFVEEYGFSFQQFLDCVVAIADLGNEIEGDVKRLARADVIEKVSEETDIAASAVDLIISQISLKPRQNYLEPPAPYTKIDVYPWRFNRELSFTRRPVIQYNNDLIWGNRQLHHMLRFTIDLIAEGKYKARKPKLKHLIGKLSNQRGNAFNHEVAVKLASIEGLIVREKVSKINGKRITDDSNNTLGDIDVLFINPERKKIVVAEVKDFSIAKSPYEMDQEYKRIFVDSNKPCFMTKHKRRVQWIKNHIEDLKVHFNLASEGWTVEGMMIVSEAIVSNAFYHQNENIVIYSDITDRAIKS